MSTLAWDNIMFGHLDANHQGCMAASQAWRLQARLAGYSAESRIPSAQDHSPLDGHIRTLPAASPARFVIQPKMTGGRSAYEYGIASWSGQHMRPCRKGAVLLTSVLSGDKDPATPW